MDMKNPLFCFLLNCIMKYFTIACIVIFFFNSMRQLNYLFSLGEGI